MTEQQRKADAGWYPHPSMAATQRYWDGEKWTDHIAPASETPRPVADFRHWGGVLVICAALAVAGVAMREGNATEEAGGVLLSLAAIIGVIAMLKLGSELVSRRR